MLTRLEVRGFKNLCDVAVDFGPFTCIAGPNGAGKSNVFDAIQFLAEPADRPLMEAAEAIRGTRSERSADPRDLFWELGPPNEHSMSSTEFVADTARGGERPALSLRPMKIPGADGTTGCDRSEKRI